MNHWEGIEEAVHVADCGTFVGAAERMGTAPSNISRAVARLEQALQTQLFTRTTRVVKLTETGRVLIDHFRRLVSERNEAFALLAQAGEPQGVLRITSPVALGERFVAPAMMQLSRDHPGLTIDLDLTNRVVDIVSEGYDLAIRTGTMADSSLVRTQLAHRRILTCAAPAYADRHGTPQHPTDLAAHECLAATSDTWHFRVDGDGFHWRPKARWRCNNGTAVVAAAIAGMGICQLPEFYVRDALADGRLRPVLVPFAPDDEPVWAVYPSRRHLAPKIRQAITRLRRHMLDHMNPVRAGRRA